MTSCPAWRTHGARIRVGSVHGLETVTLENAHLRVTVAPGKGCEIIEYVDKRTDTDYCSYPEDGPVPTDRALSLAPSPEGAFHDSYTGGWQMIFPSGGMPTHYRGAALGQHAEAATRPWTFTVETDTADEVVVRFDTTLVRLPYALSRTLHLSGDAARLEIAESATNRAPVAMEAMWGQHVTLGRPFLQPGQTISLPPGVTVHPHRGHGFDWLDRDVEQIWPHVTLAGGGEADLSQVPENDAPSEMLYLTGFDEGWYEVCADDGRVFRVEWDASALPYLWLWREFGASSDYPFWGSTYALGLEPFSSMPTEGLQNAVDNGTALRFGPGETRSLTWAVSVRS